ncbi:MAG: biopolymer transport protein TolQ [bacterium]|nr:MAG: biopolymer transport protein TolQ [bacterium]KAF0149171.1 MAG: biopolymer transport protein TolQ [bacterium]KAF0168808.1 MAG: biopolymer transport protein TolQ [bacterium]TXT20912.1 MAG: biopolymer transport protein TolQ [bacterium]
MELALAQDMTFVALIAQASWVVKAVMLLLLFASVVSWWLIFEKWFLLRREWQQTHQFEREFWGGGHAEIVRRSGEEDRRGSLEEVFRAGLREFRGKRQLTVAPQAMVESARRAMRAAYQREMDQIEAHLPFLATVGSVSPYVGLFGTVWGIMNAFIGLSNVAQATLAQVAPGIAEALIATAIGLFAAIPAVIAYNRFTHDIDRLANRHDVFMEEFSNLLQQEAARK